MALPATDTFTGSDGTALTTYSASWTNNSGAFVINTNQVRSNTDATETCAHWNADTFDNDQYSQGVFTALSGDPYIGPAVRCAAALATYYTFYSNNSGKYIVRSVAGVATILDEEAAPVADGGTMRLEISGTTLTPKVNGSTDSMGVQSDAAIATGFAGIGGYSDGSGSRLDSWEGGNLTVASATSRGWSGSKGGWW